MSRVLLSILLLATPATASASILPATSGDCPDITLLTDTESGLEFEYTTQLFHDVISGGQARDPQEFIARVLSVRENGEPVAAQRILTFLLPPDCESYTTSIVTRDSRTIDLTSRRSPAERAAGRSAGFSGEPSAEPVFTLRHAKAGRIAIPAARHLGGSRWEVATTVRVRVDYHRSTASTAPATAAAGWSDPVFDDIIASTVVNPDRLRTWKTRLTISAGAASTLDDPFAGGTEWYRIEVAGEGVVALTPADLSSAGLSIGAVDPNTIRIFSGPGKMLSTSNDDPLPELRELAIAVEGADDGVWDEHDRVLFYAPGLNRWEFDGQEELIHVSHAYTGAGVFWFTPNAGSGEPPQRIPTDDLRPVSASPVDVTDGEVMAHHEINSIFRAAGLGYIEDYFHWYWQLSTSNAVSLFAVRDAAVAQPATFRVVGSYGSQAAELFVDNATISAPIIQHRNSSIIDTTVFALDVFDPAAGYEIRFVPNGLNDHYLDYFQVVYRQNLSVRLNPLTFATDESIDDLRFTVDGDTAAIVWDVSDIHRPRTILTAPAPTGGAAQFEFAAPDRRRIVTAARGNQLLKPSSVEAASFERLRDPAAMLQTDLVAIGPREFAPAMSGYLLWRSGQSSVSTRYVAIEDIIDQYALGLYDPVAIRRFLKDAFERWPAPAPTYALLVGDGSYDFLDHLGTGESNHVPPFIVPDDGSVGDENYVYFGDRKILDADSNYTQTGQPDMLIGRWPVRNAGDIAVIAEKIRSYESGQNGGAWQSRIILVGDDEFGDRKRGRITEDMHIRDAEVLAKEYIPSRYNIEKIYLTEFPFDAGGLHKPTCADAIVDALNQGALLIDYIGHGNPELWAHERVFQRSTDLPRLDNDGFLPLVYTASCSIGFFDDPRNEGMAEALLRMPGDGAVSVVSATRLVFASENTALNYRVFDLLLSGRMPGIAAALYTAKVSRQYVVNPPWPRPNDRKYIVLGDPAMELAVPALRVAFDPLDPDSLVALGETMVTGRIVDTTGAPVGFDGTLSVIVRDAARQRDYAIGTTKMLHYSLPGGTLFRGNVVVSGGEFAFGFIVPKDVAYGQAEARIVAVATQPTGGATALGAYDSILVAGTAAVASDTTGPIITAETMAGITLRDGERLEPGEPLTVMLEDPLGINLTGEPGHRIEVFLDETGNRIADLTDEFAYDASSFRAGTMPFALPADLEPGPYTLMLRAWDNANNSSLQSWEITVGAAEELAIGEFLNYPNPFAELTTFYFETNDAAAAATIRLFTVSGRLIRELRGARDGVTSWDGRDGRGDAVAAGVYLAQLELSEPPSADKNQTVRKVAKVVVTR